MAMLSSSPYFLKLKLRTRSTSSQFFWRSEIIPNIVNKKIIGMDPAKPIFEWGQNSGLRLNEDDASRVEVYHTNSKTFGFKIPIGSLLCYLLQIYIYGKVINILYPYSKVSKKVLVFEVFC